MGVREEQVNAMLEQYAKSRRPHRRITNSERESIEKLRGAGVIIADIAKCLDINPSTVSREIQRGKDEEGNYSSALAISRQKRRRNGQKNNP